MRVVTEGAANAIVLYQNYRPRKYGKQLTSSTVVYSKEPVAYIKKTKPVVGVELLWRSITSEGVYKSQGELQVARSYCYTHMKYLENYLCWGALHVLSLDVQNELTKQLMSGKWVYMTYRVDVFCILDRLDHILAVFKRLNNLPGVAI